MSYADLWKSTRFGTSFAAAALAILFGVNAASADSFDQILRRAAVDAGFLPAESTHIAVPSGWAAVGKQFFEAKSLSLNSDVSCRDCHLDEFGSADGIPNAVGIGGEGRGRERAMGGGAIIPRNTLPLWGRGGVGFYTVFWDGRVDFQDGSRISQFGDQPPSTDALVTMVHLPAIEIREMITEDKLVAENKKGSVTSANNIFAAIAVRVVAEEDEASAKLANLAEKPIGEIAFKDIAKAIAAFIREEFRIKTTPFHRYVFEGEKTLSDDARRGALIFFGKGRCAVCHSGPYFSDFRFHGLALPQVGFGKNGFGIDYGRYNVTHVPSDLYKFRTPPLINVEKTAPYGHSGSLASMQDAVVAHFDPLRFVDLTTMSQFDRSEFYKRLLAGAEDISAFEYLDDIEVEDVAEFLKSISYE